MYQIIFCGVEEDFYQLAKEEIQQMECLCTDIQVSRYATAGDLMDALRRTEECHALFLGVDDGEKLLPCLDAFRRQFPHAVLALCSADRDPTAAMISYHPYRYFMLTAPLPELAGEVRSVCAFMRENQRVPYLLGRYYHNFIRVSPDDIIYIEKEKHGCLIHAREEVKRPPFDQRIVVREKLAELYALLRSHGFAWPHNSYLVNLKYLTHVSGGHEITLSDGTVLSVSRSKSREFMDKMLRYEEKISEILLKNEGKSFHI